MIYVPFIWVVHKPYSTLPAAGLHNTTFCVFHRRLCSIVSGNYTECVEDDSNLSDFLYVFIAGNMMHGIGGAAIYTISPPYMDANTKSKNLPVYLGE